MNGRIRRRSRSRRSPARRRPLSESSGCSTGLTYSSRKVRGEGNRPGTVRASSDHRSVSEFSSGVPVIARRKRRSEEHTSELQSRGHLVCRLLLEKKKRTDVETGAEYT